MILLKLDLNFKPPAKKVFKQVKSVVCRPRVLSFLLAFTCAGVLFGCMENFLFWHLEDLGATKLLMGLSLSVSMVAGIPLTILSSQILRLFGQEMVAFVSLALYSARMLGYSLIRHAGKAIEAKETHKYRNTVKTVFLKDFFSAPLIHRLSSFLQSSPFCSRC